MKLTMKNFVELMSKRSGWEKVFSIAQWKLHNSGVRDVRLHDETLVILSPNTKKGDLQI